MAGLERREDFGMRKLHALALPGRSSLSRTKRLALASASTDSPSKAPIRSFGPCRSARMPIGRSCFASMSRIAADQRPHRLVRGVAHVDAKNVGASLEELFDRFRCV